MRRTKYRVWDKQNKCWDESGCIYVDMEGDIYLIEERYKGFDTYMHHENVSERYEVTFWAGLTDRNGKDIYEGDGVTHYLTGNDDAEVGIVIWNQDSCAFLADFGDGIELQELGEWCIVVGNIYENNNLKGE